jgi:hypothetical protein
MRSELVSFSSRSHRLSDLHARRLSFRLKGPIDVVPRTPVVLLVPDANIVGPPCRLHEQHRSLVGNGNILKPRLPFGSSLSGSTEAFMQGLRELGYVEGQNIIIEHRYAEGKYDRLPDLAAELVRRNVDVIVAAGGSPAIQAARSATRTIPIVMTAMIDPIAWGFIVSLDRQAATSLDFRSVAMNCLENGWSF